MWICVFQFKSYIIAVPIQIRFQSNKRREEVGGLVWNGGGGKRPYYFPSTPGTVTSNIFTLLFSVTKYVHHFPDRRLLLFCALCFVMLFVCVRMIFDKAGAPFGLCAWCGVALTRQTRVRGGSTKTNWIYTVSSRRDT